MTSAIKHVYLCSNLNLIIVHILDFVIKIKPLILKVKELETDRSVEGQERLTGYNGRAALYWKEVLGMVERLQG